jgi:hypothetical protein
MPLAFPVRADGRQTFLSNETEVFDHDRFPSTEARQPSRRASHDPYEQRAQQVGHGSADGEHDEWKGGEDGAQRQLTSLFAIDARQTLTDKDHPHGPSPRRQ